MKEKLEARVCCRACVRAWHVVAFDVFVAARSFSVEKAMRGVRWSFHRDLGRVEVDVRCHEVSAGGVAHVVSIDVTLAFGLAAKD